jgi:peptidoglycan/xylan/chitin deacetylase (PgdA/CDA1 family)
MGRRQRHGGWILIGGLLAGAVSIAGLAGHASPPTASSPEAPPITSRLEGPWPPAKVLAADPSSVAAPEPLAAAVAAASCPAASPGVHHFAPGAGKTVALTFDDGPGISTEAMMTILEDAGVAATFFNIGVNESVRPALVRAEASQGFLLGNHSWSHPDFTTLSATAQASEMDRASAQQSSLVGAPPCFFRPPYGAYNSTTLSLAQARDLEVWNWSVDTEDWKAGGSASSFWVNRIIDLAETGGSQSHPVVLMHNMPGGSPATVAALPSIITFYRDRGYVFVDLNGTVADRPVTGDWDGNGTTTPGVVRGNTWYLRNANTSGGASVTFSFGRASDRAVTGDWNGDGTNTPGVVRGNTWYLRNANSGGPADAVISFGRSTDRVVTGDWDGNGTTTPGVVRGNTWYLRNTNAGSAATASLSFGRTTDRPVTGDWDGNGTTTPGVVRGNTWFERSTNDASATTVSLTYGIGTDRPRHCARPRLVRAQYKHQRRSKHHLHIRPLSSPRPSAARSAPKC